MSTQTQPTDVLATDHLHADLKGRSVRGGLWTVAAQGTTFALQTVFTVVMARLLLPADFGLVAMVVAFTGLGQAFADLGLSEATIQRQDITHNQIDALFWINLSVGLVLTLVMIALAPVLAWFYHEPRLRNLSLVLSVTFVIGGMRVQHNALLQRQMRFNAMAIRDIAASLVAVPVSILMATHGAGYWAVAAFPLMWNSSQVALSWGIVRWLPRFPRRGANVRSLVTFGGNVAGSYLINYVNRIMDNVLIGWYWGAGPLGLYSRAYNLLMLPVRQLNAPIGSVCVPAFSRLQNDPERFARFYLRAANALIWVAMPIFGYLYVAANPVIILVLGHKWQAAAPVFKILALAALAQLLLGPTNWLFVSRGQSGRLLGLTLALTPILVGSYAIGLPFGIGGVAFCGSLAFVGSLPWVLSYTFRGTQITLLRLGRAILCPVSLSLTGVVLGECALHFIAPQGTIAQLVVVALAFVGAAALALLVRPVREEIVHLKGLLTDLRGERGGADNLAGNSVSDN